MTIAVEQPDSIDGFQQLVKNARSNNQSITICGAQTKLRLDHAGQIDSQSVSTIGYSGITDHQSSDFTITVRAGTPVMDVINTLNDDDQFLPFDPVLHEKGATIGGTVAAGLNGPCRLRYGGLRDFVIGCQFVDGTGKLIRAGGKVVKNAAGFDIPKFMVGSAGQFGLLLELTLKVFPRPRFYQTAVFK